MLKKRIIPLMLLQKGRLVKTIRFEKYRDVGDPVKSSSVYNSQTSDEIILLNIEKSGDRIGQIGQVLPQISKVCFMPLTVGGGVRTLSEASLLLTQGADKVVINSAAYRSPDLITQVAERFGVQAIVVGIDIKRETSGKISLWSSCGGKLENVALEEHMESCEKHGAGEFLIQSIDQDGMMAGYDLDLLTTATNTSTVPIIGCGGSGNYGHLKEAFIRTGVSALACGSLFNFSDSNPLRAKAFLNNEGLPCKVV
jgi:cyclase